MPPVYKRLTVFQDKNYPWADWLFFPPENPTLSAFVLKADVINRNVMRQNLLIYLFCLSWWWIKVTADRTTDGGGVGWGGVGTILQVWSQAQNLSLQGPSEQS